MPGKYTLDSSAARSVSSSSSPPAKTSALMATLILLLIGLGAGVLSGIFGIGGGIVIVPALIYLTKMSLQQASGTSLAALVLPVGAIGAYTYYKAGNLDVKSALLVAVGLTVGAAIGAQLAVHVEAVLLRRAFAVLLAVVAVKMWGG